MTSAHDALPDRYFFPAMLCWHMQWGRRAEAAVCGVGSAPVRPRWSGAGGSAPAPASLLPLRAPYGRIQRPHRIAAWGGVETRGENCVTMPRAAPGRARFRHSRPASERIQPEDLHFLFPLNVPKNLLTPHQTPEYHGEAGGHPARAAVAPRGRQCASRYYTISLLAIESALGRPAPVLRDPHLAPPGAARRQLIPLEIRSASV